MWAAREALASLRDARRRKEVATLVQCSWRGRQARLMAELRRIEVDCATYIQTALRGAVQRKKFASALRQCLVIQCAVRSYKARVTSAHRRRAASQVTRFGRFASSRLQFLKWRHATGVISGFWRCSVARFELKRRTACSEKTVCGEAAVHMQKHCRGKIGRARAVRRRRVRGDCELACSARAKEDLKTVLAHLAHNTHADNPKYLRDRYREALLQFPESAAVRFGRALFAGISEKDEGAARTFGAEAQRLDLDDSDVALIQQMLVRSAVEVGSAFAYAHLALLWVLTDPRSELHVVRVLQKVLRQPPSALVAPNLTRFAERYLAQCAREVEAGSFSEVSFQDRPVVISGRHGTLSAWERGLNVRFVFAFGLDSDQDGAPASTRVEAVVRAEQARKVAFDLDRRALCREPNARLVDVLAGMLHVVGGDVGDDRLLVKFAQEAFPRLTRLAPTTQTFLSVVALPWDEASKYALDLVLHARDDVLGEEYSLRVRKAEVDALFADEHLLLAARPRPGWRSKLQPLIGRLVGLLDLRDVQVPVEGDHVVSVDPAWLAAQAARAAKEAAHGKSKSGMDGTGKSKDKSNSKSNSRAKKQGQSWYRVGRVVGSSSGGRRLSVLALVEKDPPGSLIFAEPAVSRRKHYETTIEDVRLASVAGARGSHTVTVQRPRLRIAEPPADLEAQFRDHMQRRELVLVGAEREREARRNCAATGLQRAFRGLRGRRAAHRALLGRCATRIAEIWRWRVLLLRRVRLLAGEYRRQVAAIRLQCMVRRRGARLRFHNHKLACFGETDLTVALGHMRLQMGGKDVGWGPGDATLAQHAFGFISDVGSLGDLVGTYVDLLEADPWNLDLRVGYEMACVQREWTATVGGMGSTSPGLVLLGINDRMRRCFQGSCEALFLRAARLRENNVLAAVQLSLVEAIVFRRVLAAHREAARARDLLELRPHRQPKDVARIVHCNMQERGLQLLGAQWLARRVQAAWRRRSRSPESRVEALLALRLATPPHKGSWPEARSTLRAAWSLHAAAEQPQRCEALYKRCLVLVGTPALRADVEAHLAILSFLRGADAAADADGGSFRACWTSSLSRFKAVVLAQAQVRGQRSAGVFLNAALLHWYGASDADASAGMLRSAERLEPTSPLVLRIAKVLKSSW